MLQSPTHNPNAAGRGAGASLSLPPPSLPLLPPSLTVQLALHLVPPAEHVARAVGARRRRRRHRALALDFGAAAAQRRAARARMGLRAQRRRACAGVGVVVVAGRASDSADWLYMEPLNRCALICGCRPLSCAI